MTISINKHSIIASFSYAQKTLAGIEAIDYFFAKEVCQSLASDNLLSEHENEQDLETLAHVFIALSMNLRNGHTCLAIAAIAQTTLGRAYDEQGQCSHLGYNFPDKQTLTSLLKPFKHSETADTLLVYHHDNLYMRRYFTFETELAEHIKQRLAPAGTYSLNDIKHCLEQLFPPVNASENDNESSDIDWQKLAVANAINKNFSVIAGGPGTGKTYTVTKLLAALLMLTHSNSNNETQKQALNVALVAPTGKAAQRLSESIINAILGFSGLIDDNILSSIPSDAQTIHRLLGVIPNSPNFRHNETNLLPYDVLLIDEVSMVDLPMMTRVFRALKSDTKVILLGDADQLPSVAVGSVLADIAPRPHRGYSPSNLNYLEEVCELDKSQLEQVFLPKETNVCDHLSLLMKSRRFDGKGGIGQLASRVIKGDSQQSWRLLSENKGSDQQASTQLALVDSHYRSWLLPLVKQYYQGIAQCDTINQAFELLVKFRVLCVMRQGEYGVEAINEWITELLSPQTGFKQERALYHGMPIMISENNYQLGLYNGDIGLIWSENNSGKSYTDAKSLVAYFELQSKDSNTISYKPFLPSRLPTFDTVYAMTIHKTQGSEFEHVAMVLPLNSNNQLLSRELLYTGITRAKKYLTIASNKEVWQQGVVKAVKRHSGLTLG